MPTLKLRDKFDAKKLVQYLCTRPFVEVALFVEYIEDEVEDVKPDLSGPQPVPDHAKEAE